MRRVVPLSRWMTNRTLCMSVYLHALCSNVVNSKIIIFISTFWSQSGAIARHSSEQIMYQNIRWPYKWIWLLFKESYHCWLKTLAVTFERKWLYNCLQLFQVVKILVYAKDTCAITSEMSRIYSLIVIVCWVCAWRWRTSCKVQWSMFRTTLKNLCGRVWYQIKNRQHLFHTDSEKKQVMPYSTSPAVYWPKWVGIMRYKGNLM